MIDFKYHVVSIAAVFLALAIGIVLGTNVLSGEVLKNLKTQTSDLRKQAQGLRDQNQQLQKQMIDDQNFAQALEPTVVAGRLSGRRVVVITVANTPKSVRDEAVKTLTDAGATVTSDVELSSSYSDPQQASALDELLKSLAAPAFDPTAADDVAARAASILASALTGGQGSKVSSVQSPVASSASPSSSSTKKSSSSTKKASPSPSASGSTTTAGQTGGDPRPLDAASTEVLSGLAQGGFLKLNPQPVVFADTAVIVAPAAPAQPPTPSPSSAVNNSMLDLVAALQRAGAQVVVAGAAGSADAGGLVAQLRDNGSLAKVVSAVDDVDTANGRISMVFALTLQSGGSAGQYGTGQGAQAPMPTSIPSPTAGLVAVSSPPGP